MDGLAIGIDLGTTNSCVSLYMNGKTKILENSEGGRITPSFIFFTDLQETIVGEHAKRMASGKPNNGIYEVKRLVGRRFEDTYLQKNLEYLPFEVRADPNGDPLVVVKQQNKTFEKTPRQLCTIILNKLKNDTEAKLGQVVNKAVITVPAYFNIKQREVTLAAAEDAGFTVLKLLNEPTAAALAYYFENECNKTSYSLVYDLGGGTFDVAILKKSYNNMHIVGVDGDTQLGGHDFDNLIVNYVSKKLIVEYNYDPKTDKDNLRRLHNKCEDAKKALSSVQETIITLIGFVPNHPCVQISLTREQFESIGEELFQRTIDIVDSCMKSCCIFKSTIKEIILCGGSTRIPKIQKMISDYFDGKILNKFVNPDECVAEGAALQAAMLSKNPKQKIENMSLRDVVPLSLGVDTLGDLMDVVIKKNSPIPVSAEVNHVTVHDEQTSTSYLIYEGERTDVKKNRLIGEFRITNLTPAPPGQCKLKCSMNIDENGILTVRAEEMFKNNAKELTVKYTRGNQSESEIKNTLLDAEQCKEEDQLFKQFVKIKKYLLTYCISVRYNLKKRNLVHIYKNIHELCLETEAAGRDMTMEEVDRVKEMIEEIEQHCQPLVNGFNFKLMPQRENY